MKKISAITVTTLIVIACSSFTSYSQSGNELAYQSQKGSDEAPDYLTVNPSSKMLRDDVSIKVVRDFTKKFKNVSGEKWYKISDGLIAQFTESEIETKVEYDLNGNWHCTLRTYSEDKLPFDVRDIVKSKYYDFNILVAYEITHFDNVTYILKIEDSKQFKTLRISNGNMEVIGDYVRG